MKVRIEINFDFADSINLITADALIRVIARDISERLQHTTMIRHVSVSWMDLKSLNENRNEK